MLHIALVGCGKMGGALLRGWVGAKVKARFLVVEPGRLPAYLKHKSVTHIKKPQKELLESDVIVLAVKPQNMDDVCAALKPFIRGDALVLSIAAGRSIKSFEKIFGRTQPVIRSMPNLPASVGKGVTVLAANKNTGAAHRKLAATLLQCVGSVQWLKNEKLIDAATAVSGNGPAYVFYLIEVLAEAGRKAGLGRAEAEFLARQTVIGGAALAEAEAGIPAGELRRNVTSPGGTTEAALKILMNGDMQELFDRAVEAGKNRSRALA